MIAITKRPDKFISMVETPVAVVGSELTNDPEFDSNGTWWEGGPSPFTENIGYVDVASKAGDNISTGTFAAISKTYLIEIGVVSNVGDADVRSGGGELIGTIYSPGTYKFVHTKTTSFQRITIVALGSSFVINKFSVKEVTEELTDVSISSFWTSAYNPIIYEFEISGVSDPTYYNIVEVHQKGVGLIASNRYKPEGNGKMIVDISSFLKPLIQNNYGYPLSGELNKKSDKDSLEFFIKYSENSLNSTGTLISDEGQSFFCSNSVRQIGSTQNMAEYVTIGKGDLEAKWLTEFIEPVYFDGYPFNLNFIYSELIAGSELKLVVTHFDINKNVLGIFDYDLDETQSRAINYLRLDDTLPDNVAYVSWVLEAGPPRPEGYVSAGYVEDGYTE